MFGGGGQRDLRGLGAQLDRFAGQPLVTAGTAHEVPARDATYQSVTAVAAHPDGRVFIADGQRRRLYVVGSDGISRHFAGNGDSLASGDGGPALDAGLGTPMHLSVGSRGELYVGCIGGSGALIVAPTCIHRIEPDGSIHHHAGDCNEIRGASRSGDDGPAVAATFDSIAGIAADERGGLYVADTLVAIMSPRGRIRYIDADGMIRTVAGGGSSLGSDAAALEAHLEPGAIAYAPSAGLWFFDRGNQLMRLRGGRVVAVSGFVSRGDDGDGASPYGALFNTPAGIAVSRDGRVCIADTLNFRVRCIDRFGVLDTLVGGGTTLVEDEPIPANEAVLSSPLRVAFAGDGSVLVAVTYMDLPGWVGRVRSPVWTGPRGETRIPSEDGSAVFEFAVDGTHQRTFDGLTGETIATIAYDSAGRIDTITDRHGLEIRVERTSAGAPEAIIGPYGHRTEIDLDADGWARTITDPLGGSWLLEMDSRGLLQRWEEPTGAATTFVWDDLGRLRSETGPNGDVTTLDRRRVAGEVQVDVQGPVETEPSTYTTEAGEASSADRSVTGALGLRSSAESMTSEWRETVAPNGVVMRTREREDPRFGQGAPYVAQSEVVLPSGLVARAYARRTTVTGRFDDPFDVLLHRETETRSGGRVFSAEWDRAARTVRARTAEGYETEQLFGAAWQLVESRPAGLAAIRYEHDADGRVILISRGVGARLREWRFAYDPAHGTLLSVTDPQMRTVRFDRDPAGRVTTAHQSDSSTSTVEYDSVDRVIGITPPGRTGGLDTHAFDYDGTGAFIGYRAPTTGDPSASYTQTFDGAGGIDVASRGDRTIDFERDAQGRPGSITLARGRFEWHYDDASRVDAVTGPGPTVRFEYDGFLVTETRTEGEVSGRIGVEYEDESLRIAALQLPGGTRVVTGYDDDDATLSIGDLSRTRDSLHGLTATTTLGTVLSAHAWDEFGAPASSRYALGATTLFSEAFERDPLGRIVRVTETIGGATRSLDYDYDDGGRLREVRIGVAAVERYRYHPNGGRLEHTRPRVGGGVDTGTGEIDTLERVTAHGAHTFEHAPDGARTSKRGPEGTTRYEHDEVGTLLAVTMPDGRRVEYVLDALGRRVGRKVSGTLERGWVYLDSTGIAAELDGAGAVVAELVPSPDGRVPGYMIRTGRRYRIITDVRGSVRLVVDAATGAIAQRIDYDSWGRVLRDTSPGFQPYGYAGGLYDHYTGLVRFGARDYDADTGTWLTPDPSGHAGGLNLYEYAAGDPVDLVDPRGEFPSPLEVGVGFGVGAGVSIVSQMIRNGGHSRCIDWGEVFWAGMEGAAFSAVGVMWSTLRSPRVGVSLASSVLDDGVAGACRGGLCRAGGCFTAGTMVETDHGLRAIETIEPGERVLALDERTGEQGYFAVTHTTIREGQSVIALELIGDDETELVEATGEHPFWVRDRGWVEARHLDRGDEVFTSRGGWILIGGGTWLEREQTVYNLDVEEADTYFVGESGAWVHNSCGRLTSRQAGMLDELRSGRDISARSVDEARLLVEHSGLRPYSSTSHLPGAPAPRGTFRGDLLNTRDPTAAFVHPPGSAPVNHALNPHYNLHFWNGIKAAIILF